MFHVLGNVCVTCHIYIYIWEDRVGHKNVCWFPFREKDLSACRGRSQKPHKWKNRTMSYGGAGIHTQGIINIVFVQITGIYIYIYVYVYTHIVSIARCPYPIWIIAWLPYRIIALLHYCLIALLPYGLLAQCLIASLHYCLVALLPDCLWPIWPMAHGPWPMAYSLWPMAYGIWHMAYGLWPIAHGLWHIANCISHIAYKIDHGLVAEPV